MYCAGRQDSAIATVLSIANGRPMAAAQATNAAAWYSGTCHVDRARRACSRDEMLFSNVLYRIVHVLHAGLVVGSDDWLSVSTARVR